MILEKESMKERELLNLFVEREALLKGHFILSSGRHSDQYMQSAVLLQDTEVAEELGQALAEKFKDGDPIDAVISPALGGLIIGHEVARAFGVRFIFTEKDDAGKTILRRGFKIDPGEKLLVIEDVITTGKSTNEVIHLVKQNNGEVAGVGCVVDRSEKGQTLTIQSLLKISIESWPDAECELCRQNIPAVKPGSRKKP